MRNIPTRREAVRWIILVLAACPLVAACGPEGSGGSPDRDTGSTRAADGSPEGNPDSDAATASETGSDTTPDAGGTDTRTDTVADTGSGADTRGDELTAEFDFVSLVGTSAEDRALDVAAAQSGAAVVVGATGGELGGASNSGLADAFVARYDAHGAQQWVRTLGSITPDRASAVATDASGAIYVAGRTSGRIAGRSYNGGMMDGFVAKWDANGNRQWVRLVGTSGRDIASDLALDSSGNLYVNGSTFGSFSGQTRQGGVDAFVAKFDSSGNRTWIRQFGSSGKDIAHGIAVDTQGTVYLSGRADAAIAGQPYTGRGDAFLARFEPDGTRKWIRMIGTPQRDIAGGVATDSSGRAVVVGRTGANLENGSYNGGRRDVFVGRFQTDGSLDRVRLFGSDRTDWAADLATTSGGSIRVVGAAGADVGGGTTTTGDPLHGFVASFDASVTPVWTRLLGSTGGATGSRDEVLGVAAPSDDELLIVGSIQGDLRGERFNGGRSDGFLARLTERPAP